jgi:hypothetical protein
MTFQSVTFGTDNRTIVSNDHDHLNKGVMNPNALSDAQKANVNIATRDGNLSTWNSHSGNAQTAPKVTSVQLAQPTGRVAIAGTTVTPDVLETMKVTSPELFIEPEAKAAKQAEAAAVEADAAAEASRVQLNTFVDPAAEAVAMHINSDVGLADRTQLLWQLHSTGTVSGPTLQRVAEQMHLSVDEAVESINAVHTNHSMQVATLCGAKGVDAQAFGSWAKTNRSTEMFRAIQVQANERDFVRAWSGLVDEFKARGQR